MLPIDSWIVFYADGSTFTSEDGSWADAPAFGVHAVVYYNTRGSGVDRQGRDVSLYHWKGPTPVDVAVYEGLPVGSEQPVKMGLWTDGESYWRVHDMVKKAVTP